MGAGAPGAGAGQVGGIGGRCWGAVRLEDMYRETGRSRVTRAGALAGQTLLNEALIVPKPQARAECPHRGWCHRQGRSQRAFPASEDGDLRRVQ